MQLERDEFRIQDDGIWISRKAIETLWRCYKGIVTDSVPYDMYYVGKADVLMDILKHFEPLEP